MDLTAQLRAFRPWNEQEARDRDVLLRLLELGQAPYGREDPAHLTASAWVTGPNRERDLLSAALREVREESGLEDVRPVSPDIYSVEILTVDGHEKRGQYVSSHLHLNVTFLLEADPGAPVRCKPDENSRVGWFGLEEAVAASAEPWFQTRVYSKLNAKLADFPPVR